MWTPLLLRQILPRLRGARPGGQSEFFRHLVSECMHTRVSLVFLNSLFSYLELRLESLSFPFRASQASVFLSSRESASRRGTFQETDFYKSNLNFCLRPHVSFSGDTSLVGRKFSRGTCQVLDRSRHSAENGEGSFGTCGREIDSSFTHRRGSDSGEERVLGKIIQSSRGHQSDCTLFSTQFTCCTSAASKSRRPCTAQSGAFPIRYKITDDQAEIDKLQKIQPGDPLGRLCPLLTTHAPRKGLISGMVCTCGTP